MKRLTEKTKTGWALKLDDPQNNEEARKQLMDKFKLACAKLATFEDFMEENSLEDIENLQKLIKAGSEHKSFVDNHEKEIEQLKRYKLAWRKFKKCLKQMIEEDEEDEAEVSHYFMVAEKAVLGMLYDIEDGFLKG